MKRILDIARTVIFMTLLFIFPSAVWAAAAEPVTYGAGSLAFSLTLPSGWKQQSDERGFAQFSGPRNSFFWVQRSQMAEILPADLIKWYASKGYTLLYSSKPTNVSGIQASRFILAKTDAKIEWRYDVTDAYSDGVQWVFFAVAPRASFKPELEKVYSGIYSTLKVKGKAVASTPSKETKKEAPIVVPPIDNGIRPQDPSGELLPKPGEIKSDYDQATKPDQGLATDKNTKDAGADKQGTTLASATSPSGTDPTATMRNAGMGMIAYVKGGEIWLKDIGTEKTAGYGKGSLPQLSGDGSTLVFKGADNKWKKVDVRIGGTPTPISINGRVDVVSVSPDGSLFAYSSVRKFLFGPNLSGVTVTDKSGKALIEFTDTIVELDASQNNGLASIILTADSCANPTFGTDNETILISVRISNVWGIASYNTKSKRAILLASVGERPKSSLDGKHVAYIRTAGDVRELWITSPEGKDHKRLAVGVSDFTWCSDSSGLYVTKAAGGDSLRIDLATGKQQVFLQGATGISASM